MASRGSREVGADLLGTEQRKLLDKTFKELTENCLFPCRNLQCRERKRFKGVTDNARIPCRIRVFKNDRDITEIADETIKIPDIIFREKQEQFGHQVIPWNQRTPRQLFLYNQQILERDLEIDVLKIRCICVSCNKVVSECHAVDTKEKLHLEVKEYVAHDRNLPLLYDRQSANLDLPDDASKVCALSHGPGVNRFVDEVLPRHIEAIRASLRNGALQQRLSEKSQDARTMFQDPKKTYIRIGLGLRELGGLTAILELWPQGYRSPKHHHGGCAGSVRVLHGELHCYLYKTLLDETPMEFEHGDCGLSLPHGKHQKLMLKAPATTWLNRQNWWTHEVWCGSDNPGDFALSLHLYKSCTDEFAFVKPPANGRAVLAKGGPKNDFFWNLREEGMGLLDTDDRVKEIGQGEGGRPKNFVETVLSAHAAGPSSGSGEVSPSLGYPSQPELHQAAQPASSSKAGGYAPEASTPPVDTTGWSLHKAAKEGEGEILQALLHGGADKDQKDGCGETALHCATAGNHVEAVQALLDGGADKDQKDGCGETALHYAAARGHVEAVQALLDGGADKDQKDGYGETALHCATAGNHVEAVQALLDGGADKDQKNGYGGTALHYAAERGHVAAVKALLAAGAAVNAVMNSGDTPLHKAASGDHLEVARALVAHGASPDVKDLNGFTPAALAPRKTAVAEFLEAEAKK